MHKPMIALLVLLALSLAVSDVCADDWPQWHGPKEDSVWRETGILDKFPKDGPRKLWRIPLGKGYTGPAVANGRVYVMDRQDPKEKPAPGKGKAVIERVLCLNAMDGKEIWKHEYPTRYTIGYATGPRTTPAVRDGKVYTLGAMGDLFCINAEDGKVLWSKNFLTEYKIKAPVWGWASHPVLDRGRLYCLVGGKGSAVVAFEAASGKELWRALTSKEVCYAPPILVDAGGTRQLIVWLSDSISSLNPQTGKVYWSFPYPKDGVPQRPAVSIATPRYADGHLFVSAFYHGGMMLKLDQDEPKAQVLWRGKSKNPQKPDTINLVMATPFMTGKTHLWMLWLRRAAMSGCEDRQTELADLRSHRRQKSVHGNGISRWTQGSFFLSSMTTAICLSPS